MDIVIIKSIVLALMFIVTFICCMIPVCFVSRLHHTHDTGQRDRYQFLLSLLSCAAGGVFMGTCILDLFPDVQEQIDILLSQYAFSRPFPVAEFIVVFGFLLVLTLEQIVLDCKETSLFTRSSEEAQSLLNDPEQLRQNLLQDHSVGGISDHVDLSASYHSETASLTGRRSFYGSTSDPFDDGDSGLHDHNHLFDHSIHKDVSSHSPLRSFLLLFALSLHSVFEGMAVGLQNTIDNVLALFMVVIFHKGVIAFSLSLNMVQSRLTLKQMLSANFFFCLTAPLGVGVGLGVMEMKETITTALLSGILQGIACGTFLYVTFFEVLPHEFNNGRHRLLKLMATLLGFALICGILYINPESQKYRCYREGS